MSPWISLILIFRSLYKLLLDFLLRQALPVSFAICINLVHLDCQIPFANLSNKHTIPHLCPQFVVISLSASSCSSISKLIFSTCILSSLSFLLLSILATPFAVSVTKLNVLLSPLFVPFVSFYNTITVTLATVCFIYIVDQSCHYSETAFSASHCKI